MSTLAEKRCVPCEGGTQPYSGEALSDAMSQLDNGWRLAERQDAISRTFSFRNYYQTTAFVNAVAWIAHQEDHHPDISFGYRECCVLWTTHAINGLSENDLICAAKIDRLVEPPQD